MIVPLAEMKLCCAGYLAAGWASVSLRRGRAVGEIKKGVLTLSTPKEWL